LTNAKLVQYTDGDVYRLFTEANLRPLRRWTDPDSGYSLWLLERPPFNFQLLRRATALSDTPLGVPTLEECQELWAAWDFITTKMIPDSMLFEKPIDLRHICLFYTGHLPSFWDIHLSKLLGEPNTEPEYFKVRLSITFCL
jgi:L-histidine Nalpha-methyltransferase / hercynylcysteine S-oxide synthase